MIEFDPTEDHQKHRDASGNISYTQNVRKFQAGGREIVSKKKKKEEEKLDRKEEVRARANQKLAGFREDDAPGPIEKALKENQAAEAAEANAE